MITGQGEVGSNGIKGGIQYFSDIQNWNQTIGLPF